MSQINAVLRFVKLAENALTLIRGSPRAAGLDLRSTYDTTVPARGKVNINRLADTTSGWLLRSDRPLFWTGFGTLYRHRRGNCG